MRDVGVRVYACTCSFSLFAYIWLYFVLGVATPHCVTLAEALATFAFFPLLVLLAYKVRAPDRAKNWEN